MFNVSDIVVDKIVEVEGWADVPKYEKLDIKYIIGRLILLQFKEIKYYLQRRNFNNNEYQEFWKDEDKWKFNDNKTKYVYWYSNRIVNDEME